MSMPLKITTFLDTDMHIHKLDIDRPVREGANEEFTNNKPTAMSEFSIVEFKGNYIACLILLRRKINRSDSLELAFSRIQNSGGRKAKLMMIQLIEWIGEANFPVKNWGKAQSMLLTYLDFQIETVWKMFINSVDKIAREFDCTRAKEEPEDNSGNWSATIPRCRKNNTKCRISKFIVSYLADIENLNADLENLSSNIKTKELEKIHVVSKQIIQKQKFPWEGTTCRQTGDLLIGLESKSGIRLISSNYKEHSILSDSLGYKFKHFEISKIRSK